MANRYKKIAKADQKNVDGGYKNVVRWCPRDTVTLAIPTPGVTPASGDSLRITNDHTFTDPDDGFMSWLCDKDSVTVKSKTVDDQLEHEVNFSLLGDSASTQEQLEDLIGDDSIFLLKDSNCVDADALTQFGDECKSPKVEIEFDSANTASGKKKYNIKLTVRRAKYFYEGVVTDKP